MTECQNLNNCAFFKEYQNREDLRLALKGFIRLYCKGEKQNECIRKQIKNKFGNVPINMMPNGYHLRGTSQEDWDPEIVRFLRSLG